jgi:hypothetical protein
MGSIESTEHKLTDPPVDKGEAKDRRRVPRFPFVANAEISEAKSGTWLQARTSELSWYGCFVDAMNPLPRGSEVLVKIVAKADLFEASATVVYSQPHLGMGLAFHDVKPAPLHCLRKWILEAIRATASTGPSS